MKTQLTKQRLLCIAVLLLAAAPAVSAQSIYKCTKAGGQIEYTDHACRSGTSELIHQASDSEVIHQYLDLGQDALAKNYADSHHLDVLYKDLLEARQEKMQAEAMLQANEAKQLDIEARQQALIDQAAYNGRMHCCSRTSSTPISRPNLSTAMHLPTGVPYRRTGIMVMIMTMVTRHRRTGRRRNLPHTHRLPLHTHPLPVPAGSIEGSVLR